MTDLELTIAAAEKVMQWKLGTDYVVVGDSVHKFLGRCIGAHSWLGWSPLGGLSHQTFELVEALVARRFGFRLYGPSNISPEIKDPNWVCVLFTNEMDATGNSLECARAITIACLKAVGVNTE